MKLFTSEVFSVFVLQEFLPAITFLFDQSFSLAIFICEFAITQIILENLSHHSTRKRCKCGSMSITSKAKLFTTTKIDWSYHQYPAGIYVKVWR